MATSTRTRLVPVDRYIPLTNGGAGFCFLQARGLGIRVCVAAALPSSETKDYILMGGSGLKQQQLPQLAMGDVVYVRSDRTPTYITSMTDQTLV